MKATRISNDSSGGVAPAFAEGGASSSGHGQKWRRAGLLGFCVLVCAAFNASLVSLIRYAAETSLHSHILLVPLTSGYFIYLQRSALPGSYRSSPVLGALAFAIGAAAFGFAFCMRPDFSDGDYFSAVAFSFVTLLISGGFLFLGRAWLAAVCFPVAFLYFAVPLPDGAVHWLENALKLGSAETASLFFGISDTPVLRDGVIFQLPGITLEVAQECSGIRSSWVLFITSVVASYLLLKSSWRRAALVAVVIPLSILRNGFRIWVVGLLCVNYGPQMIHSVIHESGGPLFFALSLLPLFLLLWWLRKGEIANPVRK